MSREIDALVAEKVMGLPKPEQSVINGRWIHHIIEEIYPGSGKYKENKDKMQALKNYSTDIAAAWEVAEKARESFTSSEWKQFCTELCNDWRVLCGGAPKYIVQAALKAKGIEVGE